MELSYIIGLTFAIVSIAVAISTLFRSTRIKFKTRKFEFTIEMASTEKRKVTVAPDDEKSVVEFVDAVKNIESSKKETDDSQA
jgi:hypothetical protein